MTATSRCSKPRTALRWDGDTVLACAIFWVRSCSGARMSIKKVRVLSGGERARLAMAA